MNIKYILFIVFIFVVVAIIELLKKSNSANKEEIQKQYLPYRKKQFLMTTSEYKFFQVLDKAVDNKYCIVPQVVLADIVEILDGYKWNKSYRSKIDKKTLDFVLFNKNGYTPYMVIELDDKSHERPDRVNNDHFKDEILKKVGIKLVRIKTAYNYNVEEITKIIK